MRDATHKTADNAELTNIFAWAIPAGEVGGTCNITSDYMIQATDPKRW